MPRSGPGHPRPSGHDLDDSAFDSPEGQGKRPWTRLPPARRGRLDTPRILFTLLPSAAPFPRAEKDRRRVQSVPRSKPRTSVWTGRVPAGPRAPLPRTAADGGGGGGFQEARAGSAACSAGRSPGEAKWPAVGG